MALEQSNQRVAAENEELTQFSMEGLQIARSVQRLSDERSQLQADLESKTQ